MAHTISRTLLYRAMLGVFTGLGYCPTLGWGDEVTASWVLPVSGFWTDTANWSTPDYPNNGTPPDTTYVARIAAEGAPYTVSFGGGSVSINKLQIESADASFRMTDGTLSTNELHHAGNELIISGGLLGVSRYSVIDGARATLSGGTLGVGWGYHYLYNGGVFEQTGGSAFVGTLLPLNTGLYQMSGGTLTVREQLHIGGLGTNSFV